MTANFEFLKPWHVVLQRNLTTREAPTVLQTSLSSPVGFTSEITFHVEFPADKRSRQDATQLQHVREAIELFTALAFVDNRSFAKFFPSTQPESGGYFNYTYPKWCLYLAGTLPSTDIAAIQSPVTWSTLFGLPDDSWGYSSEFQVAMQTLKAMEEGAAKYRGCITGMKWIGTSTASQVVGVQKFEQRTETLGELLAGFRKLLALNVPPVAQLFALDNETSLTKVWHQQELPCDNVVGYISRDVEIQGLAAALSKTTTAKLSLEFDSVELDTTQVKRNVGELFTGLLYDSSINQAERTARQENYGHVKISCTGVSDTVLSGTCSAVAELSSDIYFSRLERYSAKFTRWSWLTYALCCGGSESTISSVEIVKDTLIKADLLSIEAVLKTNYPLPVPENGFVNFAQYGFVCIREGAQLYLGASSDSNDTLLANSCARRCRARYIPGSSTDADAVEIIVPGYGVCKGRLGDDIQFTPDCGPVNLQQKRLSGSLDLRYLLVENAALLMDFLTLITRGLRELTISGVENSLIQMDLTALSAVTPDLQDLYVCNYLVTLSTSDEALRSWPIKFLTIHQNNCLSELSSCLKDPSVRMSRELEKLEVWGPRYLPFSNENPTRLEAHDGEFLPVTKEKLPHQAKIAMISAVASSGIGLKALHLLDAHVLSLIFVFASTPAQREVKAHY